MVLSNFLLTGGITINTILIGRLGFTSLAAVGVGGIVIMIILTSLLGLTAGMRAMVARFVGAGDDAAASHVAMQSFAISLFPTALIALTGVFFADEMLSLFGVDDDVVTAGAPYLRIMLLAMVPMAVRFTAEAVMHASGDAVNPMRIAISVRVVHVALAPSLIFGWWVFPQMGIGGAATATGLSEILGTALILRILLSGRSRLRLKVKGFRLDFDVIRRVVRIGLPALVSGLQRSLSNLIMTWLVAPFGTLVVAAHTINQRAELLVVMPTMAFGNASGVLVGQNLGAGQPERAVKSAWLAVMVAEGGMLIASVAILLWPGAIARVFTSEPELVAQASEFLKIAVAGYAVVSLMSVFGGAISGAGDTVPPMVIDVAVLLLVTLPLAYFLPQVGNLGIYGIRWAMVSGMVLPAAAFTIYFRTGRWKSKAL